MTNARRPLPRAGTSPAAFVLRGPQTREALKIADYFRLAHHWAHKYRVLGDDAEGVAMEALAVAAAKWNPARGPFAVLAVLHLRSALNHAVDLHLRQHGMRLADRPKGKWIQPKPGGRGAAQSRSYQTVSQNAVGDDGGEVDLLDQVPDEALTPEETLAAKQTSRRTVSAVRKVARRSTPRVRAILRGNRSMKMMRYAVNSLPAHVLDQLRHDLKEQA